MSLHNLAHHLQSAGRGDDKVLVHMTPREVRGLQSLAMAHGGSLTINPQTGLPEAGFLDSILPMIAGFALGPAGFALMSPMQAALTVGAVGTLATGSLGKGLMAGLGAYGGAGIGGALAAGSADDVLSAANTFKGATPAQIQQVASGQAVAGPTGITQSLASKALTPTQQMQANVLASPVGKLGTNLAQPQFVGEGSRIFATPADLARGVTNTGVQSLAKVAPETFTERLSAVGQGLKDITSDPKKLIQFVKDNPYESAALATSLASGMQEGTKFPERKQGEPLKRLQYEYEPMPIGVAGTSERNYFPNARFTPTGEVYAAGGGLMGLADGGTVEQMSRMNAVGANTMYPMASQMSQKYATPAQRPISENVIRPVGEERLDPYTGEKRFASGGEIEAAYKAAGLGTPTASQISYWTGVPDAAARIAAASATTKAAPAATGWASIVGGGTSSGATSSKKGATSTASPELTSQIEKLYQSELLRPSDPGGLEHYQKLFAGGATPGLDPDEIQLFKTAGEKEFSSPEFAARKAALTNTGGTKIVDTGTKKDDTKIVDTGTKIVDTGTKKDDTKIVDTSTKTKDTGGAGTVNIPAGAFYYGGGIPDPFGYGKTGTEGGQATAVESPFARGIFRLGSQSPTGGMQTSLATPSQVADAYERVLGRQVDLPGLEFYARQQRMTPSALEQTLQYSPEFFENLAKPLVAPISYGASGIANIEGAPYFSPTQYGYAPTYTNAKNEIIGMYQEFLGRPPDRRSLDYWTNTIGRDNYISPREVQQFLLEADKEVDKRIDFDTFKPPIDQGPQDSKDTLGGGTSKDTLGGGTSKDTIDSGTSRDTIDSGTGKDTIGGGTGNDTISTDQRAYQYNYFDNSAQDNALIRQFQTGPNEKARADLVELYLNTFKRLPDKPGFDYYMNTIGADNQISKAEQDLFLKNAQPELSQRKALEDLYKEVGGRETDIPGREYWMSQIGKAGGIDPVREQIAAGLRKEIDMANAGYRAPTPNQMGSRMTEAEAAALMAKAPFLYGTIPGTVSSQYPAGKDNNKAREQLYNLYEQKLGRTPDRAGFDYWINEFGQDNQIDAAEISKFLQGAREAGETVRMAAGGIADLGGYSDGGRLLKGPGDGVSDSIPAVIGNRQPARLADGEFVIPARIVSELGNGSTDAGARKLYAMMDRIQRARKKSVGKQKVAVNSRADKYLPA